MLSIGEVNMAIDGGNNEFYGNDGLIKGNSGLFPIFLFLVFFRCPNISLS
jgi:hypothetical protein